VVLGLLLAAGHASAPAEEAARSFSESDRNRDGVVDRQEMERRALQVFSFADNDKNAYLSRDEYDSLVLDEPLSLADTDRDGRVSTREFVMLRQREFDAADKNHDGVMSEDEAR
jgi:Ca2+-binding EF-hand superfamily protein